MKHTKHTQAQRQKARFDDAQRRAAATARYSKHLHELCRCEHPRYTHLLGHAWCLLCPGCRRFERVTRH